MSPKDEDEVVVPDDVIDPDDEPVGDDDPPGPPLKRDRRPLYALIAGLSACWFTLFGPLLAMILAPLSIYLGRRALNRIRTEGGTPTERTQAKIGFIAGIVAAAFIILQVILFQLFFEWEKERPALDDDKTTETTTEPPG